MGGKHKGEPTDRPWDEKKDGDKAGSTGDGQPQSPAGSRDKDGKDDK